jgi:hypothetical protein
MGVFTLYGVYDRVSVLLLAYYTMTDKLPDSLGTTPLLRLKTVYETLYKAEFTMYPVVRLAGPDGGVFKELIKSFGEIGAAARVALHFQDLGSSADYQGRRKAAFPIKWIPGNVNKYSVWLLDSGKSPEEILNIIYTTAKKKIQQHLTSDE